MAATLNSLIATALLLSAPCLLHSASVAFEFRDSSDATDCKPEIPPLINPNASMVTLQMHQWVWIENLTAPDWAPRTQSGSLYYERLAPGFVMQQRPKTLVTVDGAIYINMSFVTNGDTLCAAALTEFRNRSSGSLSRVSCSRICHDNFTSLGTRANLPLLVLDDWTTMTRYNEYLAFDSVDPDSRASFTCTGLFKYERMSNVPNLLSGQKRCPEGDECMFNYDNQLNLADAGCKSDFNEYSWCVSDMDLCSYNIDGDCPVCCRGDLCNREVARKAHQRWLAGLTTLPPTRPPSLTTTRVASCAASSLWIVLLCVLSLIVVKQP